MMLLAEGVAGQFQIPPLEEADAPSATVAFARGKLTRPEHVHKARITSDDIVVTATRTGGKVTLDPAFAKIQNVEKLEQIRTVIVAVPPPVTPPMPIAVDPTP